MPRNYSSLSVSTLIAFLITVVAFPQGKDGQLPVAITSNGKSKEESTS